MQELSQRIKNARVMRGCSLDELAQKMGNLVSKQALSKYERGIMKPSGKVIFQIASALDLKVDYFLRPMTTVENVEFRKKSSLPKMKEKQILEIVRDNTERYLELEHLLSIGSDFCNPIQGIIVQDGSEIENVVRELRKSWWVGMRELRNILELLEDKGIKVIEIEQSDKFDGLSAMVNNGKIPVVVINKNLSIERKRLTVMHELGHLLITFSEQCSDQQIEKLCHKFANAMLLPKQSLIDEIGEKRRNVSIQELIAIKEQYGISISAILVRLFDLGIISESYYRSFYIRYITKNRSEENLGKYNGIESSSRFDMLLFRAVSEGIITMSRAAELSNVKITDFRDKYFNYDR